MTLHRRQFLTTVVAGSGLGLSPWPARAQGLPDSAKVFVGFAAGGTVDVTASTSTTRASTRS